MRPRTRGFFRTLLEQGEVVALLLRTLVTLPLLITGLVCYVYLQGLGPEPGLPQASEQRL